MANKKSKVQVFGERLLSTALLWAAVTAVFMSMNAWAFVGMIILLGLASSREYFSMTKKAKMPCQRIWGMVISVIYLAAISTLLATQGSDSLDLLHKIDGAAIAVAVMGTFILQLKDPVEGRVPMERVATTILGFLYIPFLFSFMARLLFLPEADGATATTITGAWLVLWTVAVTKFTDMGAYITGTVCSNFMKTHKMIPHISPGKTWEGFVGALFFAQLAGCGLYAMMADTGLASLVHWGHVIALGFILSLLAVVGDLAESVVKRSLDIKDSGQTLPGIGGALDLIDSLCFTAPVVYFYLVWIL